MMLIRLLGFAGLFAPLFACNKVRFCHDVAILYNWHLREIILFLYFFSTLGTHLKPVNETALMSILKFDFEQKKESIIHFIS